MICMVKGNGKAGCGARMIAGCHYAHSSPGNQEAGEAMSVVSWCCPNCGNYLDDTIQQNRLAHAA